MASGLYNRKEIAVPNPNSDNAKKDNILENNPFRPRYSAPNVYMKTVLLANDNINVSNLMPTFDAIFNAEFLVLESFKTLIYFEYFPCHYLPISA